MRGWLSFLAFACTAAFLAAYALGEANQNSENEGEAAQPAAAVVATGQEIPVSRAVPVPAAPRLPRLEDAPAPRPAPVAVRRAPAAPVISAPPAPAPAPAPAPPPAPKPETGTPFFNAK